MGSIVVRGLDDAVKQKFREVAAAEGSSMEGLLRKMIEEKVAAGGGGSRRGPGGTTEDVPTADVHQTPWILELREAALKYGGLELELPERHVPRAAPDFSDLLSE